MAVEPNVVSLNRETEKVEFEDLTEHGFLQSRLGEHHDIYLGRLPIELLPSEQEFECLWNLHPAKYPTCKMHGRSGTVRQCCRDEGFKLVSVHLNLP